MNQLYIWTDKNGNGSIDAGELESPQTLSITALLLQRNGNSGSYVRNGVTERMWDWWPSVVQVVPSTSAKALSPALPAACSSGSISLQGSLASPQTPDLTTSVASSSTTTTWTIPLAMLTARGFNANASQLARVSPSGNTIALVDYRQAAPHTARLWLLTRATTTVWNLTRFSLPETSLEQVLFTSSGSTLFVLAQNQTHLYVLQHLPTGAASAPQQETETPTLSSLAWNTPHLGFRTLWGTPLAQGNAFYLPGYFYATSEQPRCTSLAQLTLDGEHATLQPFSNLQWLDGDLLSSAGYAPPFVYQLVSPDLAYAAVRNNQGTVTLLEIAGRQATDGEIIALDTMQAIGGLSANGTSVEYLALQANGLWQMRWVDVTASATPQQRSLSLATLPSYPELAGNGSQALWAIFDWIHGTTALWGLNTAHAQATPQQLFSFPSMTGAIRVASTGALLAVQTPSQLLIKTLAQ